MIRYFLSICLLLVLVIQSCRERDQATSTGNSSLSKSDLALKNEFALATDSLTHNWQRMSESDERKMASIRRLLDEISYTPRYNTLRQRQLLHQHERVKRLRYNQQTMASSELIDRFDAAQDSLVNGTLTLAAETPDAEKFPLISDLSNDIQNEHNKIIIFRIKHDTFGRAINKLVEENPRKVKKLGEPFASQQRVPLFSLSGK